MHASAHRVWRLRGPTPVPGGLTVEQYIRQANENYGRFFEAFLEQQRININDYNAIIGPEFVRGGKQLCVLMKNGRPSPLEATIRSDFRLLFAGGKDVRPVPVVVPAGGGLPPNIPTTNTRMGRIAGNQAAMALVGQMLGSLALAIGEIGIERQVRNDLQTKKAQAITDCLSRDDGVLVIICLAQWKVADNNNMKAKMFQNVYIEPGSTPEAAFNSRRTRPHFLELPPEGWDPIESYSWISPY